MDMSAVREDEPFHAGEQAVQERVGVRDRMRSIGQRVIRTFMPDQHQQFFAQLPFVLVGSVDPAGRPWASVLVGEPGFMRARDEHTLDIHARPIAGDPLADGVHAAAPLGLLGIELDTRRRNRINGHVRAEHAHGFTMHVDQTVGNCPQYIQAREFEWVRPAGDQRPRAVERLEGLDAEARALVARSDTLFVATHAPAAASRAIGGADVSHRGGRGGFVRVDADGSFVVPEFSGNFFFMTLGNLQLEPRAGVLFIDFETGDLLTLTGTTEMIWEGAELEAFAGAERAWRFRPERGRRLRDALPLRWNFREWSPNSLITGTWEEAARRQEAQHLAETWRPYQVTRVVDESSVIRSFYLQPADGHAVPSFEAGQHLPIKVQPAGAEAPLLRTYTISQAPSDEGVRLSVKREGVVSSHLHDHVHVGDVIEALGPKGQFTIDATLRRPAVLIGAGVGVTPMMAFLRHLVTEGFRIRRTRPVHFIQVAHDESRRAFGAELSQLEQRAGGAVKVHLVLSSGGPGTIEGPLTVDTLKRLLPFDDHEFFLCGPAGFMQAIYDGLRDLGVRDERIRAESFGRSALRRRPDAGAVRALPPPPPATEATVVFSRSGEAAVWTPEDGTLLELAEGKGLSPPFSCRGGNCGSCATRMTAGRVTYAEPTAWKPADCEVLLCCARPARDGGEHIELDL